MNIEGMTLRDYFAAKAMAALMGDFDCTPNHPDGKPTTSGLPPVDAARRYDEALAYQAYCTADAMMAHRTQRGHVNDATDDPTEAAAYARICRVAFDKRVVDCEEYYGCRFVVSCSEEPTARQALSFQKWSFPFRGLSTCYCAWGALLLEINVPSSMYCVSSGSADVGAVKKIFFDWIFSLEEK